MKKLGLLFLSSFTFTLIGCSHSLEIKNLSQYQSNSFNTVSKELSMGIITANSGKDGQLLVTGAAQALSGYIGQVVYPYSAGNSVDVDIISKISISSDHKGSGYNFWINFPGFLIWAPAWNGYVYEPSYKVDVNMMRADDNSTIESFSLPINLDVRHASIERTWTEISWFEVGAIAFIGGLVFMQYDNDVTPLVDAAIQKPIGDFIAQEMTNRLRNAKGYKELVQKRKGQKPNSLDVLPN
ncbi:MAG: hypothetical protein HXX17_06360 [Geobacteraceae bacterium]|nr:hypothetical protein [Geobacteraceae bacterium]